MLTDDLRDLAELDVPEIFEEVATHVCDVLRGTATPTGYGGEETVDAIAFGSVPCVYKSTPGSAKYQLGREYLSGRIQMPRVWQSQTIDLKLTDRIRLQAGAIADYTRTFQVRDINPNYDVFWDVGVTQEDGDA